MIITWVKEIIESVLKQHKRVVVTGTAGICKDLIEALHGYKVLFANNKLEELYARYIAERYYPNSPVVFYVTMGQNKLVYLLEYAKTCGIINLDESIIRYSRKGIIERSVINHNFRIPSNVPCPNHLKNDEVPTNESFKEKLYKNRDHAPKISQKDSRYHAVIEKRDEFTACSEIPSTTDYKIKITSDYRIFDLSNNGQEILMNDLPKAFYLFILRHNDGVNFDEIGNRDNLLELTYIYIKVRKSNKHNPINVITKLKEPNNQINNIKTGIRNAFKAYKNTNLEKEYTVEKIKFPNTHKEGFSYILNIKMPRKECLWQCIDIKNLSFPHGIKKEGSLKEEIWRALKLLNDEKINKAIGVHKPE